MGILATARQGIALGICAAALLGLAVPVPARATGQGGATTVVVTMTDSKLTVAPIYIPAGPVVFQIANKATVARDFKVGGKRTAKIEPGRSAMLSIDVTTEKNYPYYSAAQGHATLIGIVVAVPTPCTEPKKSTIAVKMTEGPIRLSRASVPCGPVKFVVTNAGKIAHTFTVFEPETSKPATGADGPSVKPGKTATVTVEFATMGRAAYFCAARSHVHTGERGILVVT